jgi:DNA-directed RNA polymerase subunit E'/Rpb7
MDPLFERRELSKKIHIYSKFLQKNMQASILAQLKMSYEGRCSAEGFIQQNSITIVNYSLGRSNYIKGGADYDVVFQADVCFPHAGQIFKAPVAIRSKVGIHAETPPIQVLIPRDLHIGNTDFENIRVGDNIEFEVVGAQFKQQDRDIVVVARLRSTGEAPKEEEVKEDAPPPPVDAVEGTKNVVTTPAPVKRKLRQAAPKEDNELVISLKEGESKGSD